MNTDPTPVSRDSLRSMRTEAMEKARQDAMKSVVKRMYENILQFAKSSTDTKKVYSTDSLSVNGELSCIRRSDTSIMFYTKGSSQPVACVPKDSIDDVIHGLKQLFPDCVIMLEDSLKLRSGDTLPVSAMNNYDEIVRKNTMVGSKRVTTLTIDWS